MPFPKVSNPHMSQHAYKVPSTQPCLVSYRSVLKLACFWTQKGNFSSLSSRHLQVLLVVRANKVIWQIQEPPYYANMYHTTHPMKSVAKSWTMMMPSPMQHIPLPSSLMNNISTHNSILCCDFNYVNLSNQRGTRLLCSARRQIRYQDGDDADSDEEYGHNEQISKLESYSQSAKGEVLVVHALVDQEKLMCLSSR